MVNDTQFEKFLMNCTTTPPNDAELHYEIHKLPANRITSTSTLFQNGGIVSEMSPFSPTMP
jgi:hypothetical protein